MSLKTMLPNTRDELRDRLLRVVSEQFGVDFDHLGPATELASLTDDSIGALELTMAIEDALDIEIPDTALDQMRTFQEVTNYLADRLGL
jgi:acyl carrier protein